MSAGGEGGLQLLVEALRGLLGLLNLAPGLVEVLAGTAHGAGRPTQGLQRPRRKRGERPAAQSKLLLFPLEPGLGLGDLALQFPHLGLEGDEPVLLLLQGLDAGGVLEQGLVEFQAGGLGAELLPRSFDFAQQAAALLEGPAQGVEPLDGALGQGVARLQGRALLIQELPLLPAVAERRGQLDRVDVAAKALFLVFQPGDLAVQVPTLLSQGAVAAVEGPGLDNLLPDPLLLGQQLGHLACPARRIQQPIARARQLPHHVDQRDAIEPDGQTVEERRDFRVLQHREFLKLAEPHGKDVIEDRLVHVAKERLEKRLALPRPVRCEDQQLAGRAARVRALVTRNDALAGRARHPERSAGLAAVDRGQIAPPLGREPVEH